MNRFKKTMALTAACVIAATTVNVGSVAFASGDSPSGDSSQGTESVVTGEQVVAASTDVQVEGITATVVNDSNTKIKIILPEQTIANVNLTNSLKGFSVTRTKTSSEEQPIASIEKEGNDNIVINLKEAVLFGEVIEVTYNPALIEQAENKVKVATDKNVKSFGVEVDNQVGAEDTFVIQNVEKVKLAEGEKTTSKIKVTFDKNVKNLKASEVSFEGNNAKVEGEPASADGGTTYEITIKDVRSATLKISVKRLGYNFGQAKEFKVDYVAPPSTGGGGGRSSVRPDSSTPANKEDAKKDEMKNEPKKDEMKKDEVSNATSTDKVSTKLVIGQKTYTAMVNGQAIEKTMDVAPMVHQGRTVLPARMISELLGVDVKFDQKSKTANFMYGEAKVQLTLGQKFMLVNGEKVALSADILNKDGRILLPVTDIQKAFAKLGLTANVSWDADTKSVTVNK